MSEFSEALCREFHPLYWDVAHGNRNRPCVACLAHAARLSASWRIGRRIDGLPVCEGWLCQSPRNKQEHRP